MTAKRFAAKDSSQMTELSKKTAEGLTESKFLSENDPIMLFSKWLAEAQAAEPCDANAMALATVDADGLPNVRVVLLKDHGPKGFVFYTSIESAKGMELAANPKAAFALYWKSLGRQIRVRGRVEPVSDAEADAYFATRPYEAQIGAVASKQSRQLASRDVFEKEIAEVTARYKDKVPRPPYWCGYRIIPLEIEFWAERPYRLHDRLLFSREDLQSRVWQKTRLYP
jgi:pyridoxamine 5'-phosphate oxidase